MAKRISVDDIIISKEIGDLPGQKRHWVNNEVVMIERNIESKRASQIVADLKKILPKAYYISTLGPGQYQIGSTYSSLKK